LKRNSYPGFLLDLSNCPREDILALHIYSNMLELSAVISTFNKCRMDLTVSLEVNLRFQFQASFEHRQMFMGTTSWASSRYRHLGKRHSSLAQQGSAISTPHHEVKENYDMFWRSLGISDNQDLSCSGACVEWSRRGHQLLDELPRVYRSRRTLQLPLGGMHSQGWWMVHPLSRPPASHTCSPHDGN
jgi:hypothetical protein